MGIAAALTPAGLADYAFNRSEIGQIAAGLSTHGTGAAVRGGVIPANGTPLAVVAGSGLNVTVKAGQYEVAVSDASRGPVFVTVPADLTLTCTTASGSNPRIDTVIAEVLDTGTKTATTLAADAALGATTLSLTATVPVPEFYTVGSEMVQINSVSGSGPYTATLAVATTAAHSAGAAVVSQPVRVRIVPGLPAGTPAAPSTNWLTPTPGTALSLGQGAYAALANIAVAQSATSVGTITDRRAFTVAAGGLMPVDGAYATPSLAATLPPWTPVWDATAKKILVRDTGSGLIDPDVQIKPRAYTLLRSAVPASGLPEDIAGMGYLLTWVADAAQTTTDAPATTIATGTTVAGTELVIGTAGWYRLEGFVNFHAQITTTGDLIVQYNLTGSSGWVNAAVEYMITGASWQQVSIRPTKFVAGGRIRIGTHRVTPTSGDVAGGLSLTLERPA